MGATLRLETGHTFRSYPIDINPMQNISIVTLQNCALLKRAYNMVTLVDASMLNGATVFVDVSRDLFGI